MKKLKIAFVATLLTGAITIPIAQASAQEAPVKSAAVSAVGTFDVEGETFKVKFTKQADIDLARQVLAGKADPVPHPHGTIVYGSADVNTGYSWHLDPAGWAEQSTEVCDGLPRTDVEAHKLTSKFYCPWVAKLIALN